MKVPFFEAVLGASGFRVALLLLAIGGCARCASADSIPSEKARSEADGLESGIPVGLLDAPLLFVKRHSYVGIHIYDTFYKWVPGGGIYVLENPAAPPEEQRVRAVIDPSTPGTLGEGIYSEPDLSWDGRRLLFCFKGLSDGSTSIHEIGVDGTGLRRLTDPRPCTVDYHGSKGGVHDLSPAYLPDGRIVFTSTRQHGLVPCANKGVDILHVMEADGSDLHAISVNNVNEFDPSVLPDGRILHGRWEYVDKTALTQQSLWTIFGDGTNETALFANNLVHPEALLDARAVPGAPHLVVASFTRHNAPPRGSIAMVDSRLGKDSPGAITNFEFPDDPTHDQGNSCDPWPLSSEVVLFSGRPEGAKYNAIEWMDRGGRRGVVISDESICCHSPMLVKARPRPVVVPRGIRPKSTAGRFFVQDIYQGLVGVEPGEVKWLRVIEETSRTSGTAGGALNQTFLVSGALAFSVKNFLGVVPVEPDGSAYFELPAGRALYLQALDADGRLVRSMRTFVQASPGVTRTCIGCHEHKYTTPSNRADGLVPAREPARPKPESWGSGYVDYARMVQPVLDRRCVSCHGGEEGIGGGMDLSGGWTELFNISYENLITRRESQLVAYWISGIDCMNGTANWSAQIFPPRAHGSGSAPLAEVLVSGHEGRIADLTRAERDLLMAWIDTNGVYYGTWDYTDHGCQIPAWVETKNALVTEMRAAGCLECHGEGNQVVRFEDDWFNLEHPRWSRILRAPLAKSPSEGDGGLGLALCRKEKVDPARQRIHVLRGGRYLHAVLPLEAFPVQGPPEIEHKGETVVRFASTTDPHYRAMLAIIGRGRRQALLAPRADMPGAKPNAGTCRRFLPTPLPASLPALRARVDGQSVVHLAWECSAKTIGLVGELHRGGDSSFTPTRETLLTTTTRFEFADDEVGEGSRHYALVLRSTTGKSGPIRASVVVPPVPVPPMPAGVVASAAPGRVELRWEDDDRRPVLNRYCVYRASERAGDFERVTPEPIAELGYVDGLAAVGTEYAYAVRAVNRRGVESEATPPVVATPLPEVEGPVFSAAMGEHVDATLHEGVRAKGTVQGKASMLEGVLDLRQGGCVAFDHRPEFELTRRLSVEVWVHFTEPGGMPVVVSSGHWREAGWFLQRIGAGWRWHVGGIDCDGGRPVQGRWTHLVGTFDGRTARLYQDGELAAQQEGSPLRKAWTGPLYVGQYSGGPEDIRYQVTGLIHGLRIYHRILDSEAAARRFEQKPPVAVP